MGTSKIIKPEEEKRPLIIGICGRSCSGKSKLSKHIEEKYFGKCTYIEQDKFFKIKSTNWESPDAVRFDRLIHSIEKLKNREETHIPSHRWTENFDKKIKPHQIILVEGFLLFTQKKLAKLFDLKIYIDVSDINILYRRLKRNGNINEIDYIMNSVIPESKRYEEIQKKEADIIIDGNKTKEEILNEFEGLIKKWQDI